MDGEASGGQGSPNWGAGGTVSKVNSQHFQSFDPFPLLWEKGQGMGSARDDKTKIS